MKSQNVFIDIAFIGLYYFNVLKCICMVYK